MSEFQGFIGAISNNPHVLDSVILRIAPARRQKISRFFLGANGRTFDQFQPPTSGEIIGAAIFCNFSAATSDDPQHMLCESPQKNALAWVAGNVSNAEHKKPIDSAQIARLAYQRWGINCYARCGGNFCMAIYDPVLRVFRIASDLAGTKPVFYNITTSAINTQTVIFGSSAKDVLRAGEIPAFINAQALKRYMSQGVLAGYSDTLFQDIHSVRRHHYIEINPFAPLRVSQIAFPDDRELSVNKTPLHESAQKLRSILLSSIEEKSNCTHLAVALSGGIDSSGILACLRHLRGPSEPLNAFFYRQSNPAMPEALNEQPWAELAAKYLNVNLNSVEMRSSELPKTLKSVVRIQDFPFSSPVILAQAKLFRIAAESGIKVMLSGHGPDLLFGGGDSHLAIRLVQLIQGGQLIAAAKMLRNSMSPASAMNPRFLLSVIRQSLGIPLPAAWHTHHVPWACNAWFRARVMPQHEEVDVASKHFGPMHALIHKQLSNSLGSTSMLYEENNALSNGMTNHYPYYEAAMIHFSRSCHPEYLISECGQSKHILRLALNGLVPHEILQRRNRIGFAVPALPWLLQQRPWVEQQYRELRSLPFFRGPPPARLWPALESATSEAWSNANLLWRWIILLEWARTHEVRFH